MYTRYGSNGSHVPHVTTSMYNDGRFPSSHSEELLQRVKIGKDGYLDDISHPSQPPPHVNKSVNEALG